MDKRYTQFNEVTFEAYIKSAIDKSVMKIRMRKSARSELEQTFSMLTDEVLYTLAANGTTAESADCRVFDVRGIKISVYGYKLGQVISYLMPRDREIILLYFFLGLNDQQIGKAVKLSRAAVQRHRKNALKKLQILLGGTA